MQIATGSYVGDGTDGRRIVTGLSGRIVAAGVQERTTGEATVTKTAAQPTDTCTEFGIPDARGMTIDGADFIVDQSLGADVNELGNECVWTAESE